MNIKILIIKLVGKLKVEVVKDCLHSVNGGIDRIDVYCIN